MKKKISCGHDDLKRGRKLQKNFLSGKCDEIKTVPKTEFWGTAHAKVREKMGCKSGLKIWLRLMTQAVGIER